MKKRIGPSLAKLGPAAGGALPLLVIGGAVFFTLKWLLSDGDKKPEAAPADAKAEGTRKEAESPCFRPIPPDISAKTGGIPAVSAPRAVTPPPTVVPPSPAVVPPPPVVVPPTAVKVIAPAPMPAPVAVQKTVTPAPPSPTKKKFITRQDVAAVFHHGTRTLTRPAAVAALKNLGFGKTAAYDALTVGGRFADSLQFGPDGTMTWAD